MGNILGAYPQDAHARLFTGAGRGQFVEFLRSRLDADTPGAPFADLLLHSGIAPSRQLLTVVADELANREQFVLLDEQRVAVDLVLAEVEQARSGDHKSVVVVQGGPGSGKSVIALSLMGELAARGRTVVHTTGSKAFTTTLRKLSGQRNQRATSLFKYFNSFIQAERNGWMCWSWTRPTGSAELRRTATPGLSTGPGRPQLDELLSAARVPVFLLDEHQVVRPGEMGTVAAIREAATRAGLTVHVVPLRDQFRCGGSELYEQWVVDLLGLSGRPPWSWTGDGRFTVEVVPSPDALESALRRHLDDGYNARMTAGYCWPWSDPNRDGTLVADVQIDGWSRPWNLRGDRALPGAPPSSLWASQPDGFNQVGCVYTAQGFEYDWNGVIIGPDFVWRDDRWVSRREFNKDPDFRSRKSATDEDFDVLVRNVYKLLLTRGMVGTLLHSADAETREFLDEMVGAPGRTHRQFARA